jgi:hypothetical protein
MSGSDRPMPPSGSLPEREPELRDLAVLARILQVALVVAFVLALGGAFVPGRVGHVSEVAMLVVLIGAPVLRVAWLTVDWARERDRVFVGLGLVLLAVMAVSGLIKFL